MQDYDFRVDAENNFLENGWFAIDGEWRRRPICGLWTTISPIGRHLFEILVERDDEYENKTLIRRVRRCQSLLEAKVFAWNYVEPHLIKHREQRQLPKTVLITPAAKPTIRPSAARTSVRSDRFAAKKNSRRATFRPAPSVRA
jgi:hypothetical protein